MTDKKPKQDKSGLKRKIISAVLSVFFIQWVYVLTFSKDKVKFFIFLSINIFAYVMLAIGFIALLIAFTEADEASVSFCFTVPMLLLVRFVTAVIVLIDRLRKPSSYYTKDSE
jgi:hypothetical protein